MWRIDFIHYGGWRSPLCYHRIALPSVTCWPECASYLLSQEYRWSSSERLYRSNKSLAAERFAILSS